MLNKDKYPIGHFWIDSQHSDHVDPQQFSGWSARMLSGPGQKRLSDRMHLRSYDAEKGHFAWDIEQCLRQLVSAGELMDQTKPLPVPTELPSRDSLNARFGKQLEDLFGGIECLDGWNGLLYVMFEAIEKAQVRGDVPEDFRWGQIKEKFGTIRLYYPPSLPEFEQLVHCIDRASAITCEVCGQPGQLFTEGWCKVRCPEHGAS